MSNVPTQPSLGSPGPDAVVLGASKAGPGGAPGLFRVDQLAVAQAAVNAAALERAELAKGVADSALGTAQGAQAIASGIDAKASGALATVSTHVGRTDNPHGTTADQVGALPKGIVTLNAKSYGATGDGSTNDTAAIALAIAAAEALTSADYYGGPIAAGVYLPPGRYKATIDISSRVSLWGDGPGSVTVFTPAGANRACIRVQTAALPDPTFRVSNFKRATIRGITIDGNPSNQTSEDAHGIEFPDAEYSTYAVAGTLSDVVIVQAKGHCIRVGSNRNWLLADRVIANNAGSTRAALHLNGYDHRFSDCDFGSGNPGSSHQIEFNGGSNSHFDNCGIYGGTTAIAASQYWSGYTFFTACTIVSCQNELVYLYQNSGVAGGGDPAFFGFVDCDFSGASQAGNGAYDFFHLLGAVNLSILGGRFRTTNGVTNKPRYILYQDPNASLPLRGHVVMSGVQWQGVNEATPVTTSGVSNEPSLIFGSNRERASSGVRYNAFNAPVELRDKTRLYNAALSANWRTWLINNASNRLTIAACNDGESGVVNAIDIQRGHDGTNPTISKVTLAGATYAAPPGPYADDAAAATAGVAVNQIYRKASGVLAWRVS
jgi:hypothetical protein